MRRGHCALLGIMSIIDGACSVSVRRQPWCLSGSRRTWWPATFDFGYSALRSVYKRRPKGPGGLATGPRYFVASRDNCFGRPVV